MKRRIVSVLTALALMLSLCPTWAFAAEADPSLCKHHRSHTADCGYTAPTEGHDCGHSHTDECYTEETLCVHAHDETCYSDGELPAEDEDKAADVCAHVCSAESGCVTRTLNCRHSHGSECGYVQFNPGTPCGYECKLCPIEALIAALPEQVTEDNADDARARLDEILALYGELTGDEQGQLDLTRVYALQEALAPANAPVTAAEGVTTVSNLDDLKAAVDKANGGEAVSVELEADISETYKTLISLEGGSLTLDLKGRTLSSGYGTSNYGVIEITGGTLVLKDSADGGSIVSTNSACAILVKGGAVTVEGGTVSASAGMYTIRLTGGSLEVDGGAITNSYAYGAYAIYNEGGAASVTIRGGTVQGGTGSSGYGVYMNHAQSSLTVLENANISGVKYGIYISNAADVQIAGGSIKATGTSDMDMGLGILSCTSIALSGGTFSGQDYAISLPTSGDFSSLLKPAESGGAHWAYKRDGNVVTGGLTGYTLSSPVTVAQCDATMGQATINDDGTHSRTCSDCGQVFTAPHTGTGTCEVCGAPIEYPVEVTVGGDTTQYISLSLALAALSGKSGTFKLLKNVTTSQTLTVSSGMDVTVEMVDGATLTNDTADCFKVDGGALTLASGTVVEGKSGSSVVYAKSGTLRMTGATCRSAGNGLWVDSNVAVQLSGGAISVPSEKTALRYGSKAVKDMLADGCALKDSGSSLIPLAQLGGDTLSGGDYTVGTCDSTERDIQSNGDGTHSSKCPYCSDAGEREACTYEFGADGTGTCTVCGATGTAVASVEVDGSTTFYSDIQSAWAAVNGKTATLTLLKSADAGREMLRLTGGDVTLEMEADVVLTASSGNAVVYVTGGKLTLKNGTVKNTYDSGGIGLQASGGDLEITGGAVEGRTAVMAYKGTVKVTGGTFTGTGNNGIGLQKGGSWDSTVRISGGTFSGNGNSVLNARAGETLADLLAEGYAFKRGDAWADASGNSLTGNVTVEEAPVKIIEQPQDVTDTYGELIALNLLTTPQDSVIRYQWYQVVKGGDDIKIAAGGNDDGDDPRCILQGLNAGEYQFYCRVSDSGYKVKSETVTVTVTPKQLRPFIEGTASKTYDGTTECAGTGLSITLTEAMTGYTVNTVTATAKSYTYDTADAGEYKTITASGIALSDENTGNYKLISTTATADVGTIIKSTPVIAFQRTYNPDKTYDGQVIPNPTSGALTISGAHFNDVTFTWSATPQNAGTYTLTATIPETTNTAEASAEKTVTINKATLTVTGATITARAYQPNVVAADVSGVTFDGLQDGEDLTLGRDYTATGTFADANAGEKKNVTVTVTLKDTAEANYQLSSGTCTATGDITKADPAVTGVSVSTPTTIYESTSLDNIALTHGAGPAGTVTLDAGQTLTVGTKEYNWTFTPNDTDNYNTATGKISLTVAEDTLQSIAVTTAPTNTTYTYGDTFAPAGMVVTATYASGATKVVTDEVTISPATLTAATTELTITYQGKTTTQAITVSPKTVRAPVIELSPSTFVYDGTGKEPAVTVKDGTTVIPASEYTVGYSNNTNAGTATVTITDKTDGNYTVSGSATFTITAKPITGALVRVTGPFTYTGSAQTPDPVVTLGEQTLVKDTDYTVAYAGNTDAGTATITVTGKGNYSGTAQGTFTIGRADLTVDGNGTANGTYGAKLSELIVFGLTAKLGGSAVTGTWKLTGDAVPNAGDSGQHTVVFTPDSGAGNYNALTAQVTLNIAKAPALTPKTGTLDVVNNQAHTYTYGLGALRPNAPEGMSLGSTPVTYTLGTVSLGSYYGGSGAKIEGQTLTLPIQAVERNEAEGIGTITVTIHTGNFEDMTATINVRSVNKTIPTGAPTLSAATLTYGQSLSSITLSGSMKDGSADVPGTFTWSSPDNRPAVQEAYAAAWVFKPDDNNTYAIVNGTSTIKVVPASVAGAVVALTPASFRYDGQPHSPAVTSVKLGDTTLTANTDYTVEIPAETTAGTYTVTVTGKGNYTGTAAATFTINPVKADEIDQKDNNGRDLRLEVETGLSTVPEALKNKPKYDTPAKIEAELRTRVEQFMSNVGENIAVFDVTLQYKDANGAWCNVDPDAFPVEGVTAILPYPAGTGATGYTFTVQHLISSGTKAGTMETLSYTLTADGLQCKFSSLSPVAIGYQAAAKPNPNPGGNSGGGWSGVSTYAVTVEKSEHGKVTSNLTNASSGSTVTLTVTPDSGYVLDTLTVTDSRGGEIKLTAQGNGKYTFTMPSRAVTVKAAFAPRQDGTACDGGVNCPSHGFTDLGSVGTWYHEAVDYVLRNNLMGGYGNGKFGPNDNLSRAQFAQILFNKEGRPVVNYLLRYNDVAADAWYTEATRWATSQGIVGGYGNGMFGPNDNITREQLAVMLWRYAGSPAATEKELHFTDTDKASGFALEALRWAVENGAMDGYGDGRLDPKGLATRAQVAQMLKNYLEK